MCGAPLDDWVIGGSADDFFAHGEYAFCPKETCCYSSNGYGIMTKLYCIASRKQFDISLKLIWNLILAI